MEDAIRSGHAGDAGKAGWFPGWFHRLPGFSNSESEAESAPKVATRPNPDRNWLLWGYCALLLILAYRLAFLGSGLLELCPDEAYQWTWSKHLALSYYSKPPLIALTQFAGTWLFGDTEFGVRFFSPVIAGLLGFLVLRFFACENRPRLGFAMVLICNATPLFIVGANLMTVDPLSVLFWTAAMLAGWRAIQPEGSCREWSWVGLWMGLGFLSKYTELFQILCWAVFFWLWRPARLHLRRPGPYLALLINLALALPVLVWNAQHEWITIRHVGDHAQFGKTLDITFRYVFDFIGAEAALLNPVFFCGALWAGIALWRQRAHDPLKIYFFSMGAPVVIAYLLQSFHARVLPNWIAPAILPLFILMALHWEDRFQWLWVKRVYYAGLVLGVGSMMFLTDSDLTAFFIGRFLPASMDPLARVRGWDSVARLVGSARYDLIRKGDRPVFVLCPDYGYTGELTFYMHSAKAGVTGQPLVYCRLGEQPENQFFFWPEYRYQERHGDNAIYYRNLRTPNFALDRPPMPEAPPAELLQQFRSVRSLGVHHGDFRGRAYWWFQLYECLDQK